MRLAIVLAVAVLCAASSGTSALAQQIDWRVKDRFRLFDQAPDPQRREVEDLLATLAREGRPSKGVDLAKHYDRLRSVLVGEAAERLRSSAWNAATRTYRPGYVRPSQYRFELRLAGAQAGQRCRWRVDHVVFDEERPCGDWTPATANAQLEAGRRYGAANVEVSVDAGPFSATQTIRFEDLLIVALGDSFIAGEGNPDVPAVWNRTARPPRRESTATYLLRKDLPVTSAKWWDEPCHRSLLSWPVLASLHVASLSEHRAVTLVHLGCSGAEAREGIYGAQRDLPGDGRNESQTQLQQLTALLGSGDQRVAVNALLLSLGGNDVGFADVVATLATPPNGYRLPFGAWIVGQFGDSVCPYRVEAPPLSNLCGRRASAQERIDGYSGYDSLRTEYSNAQDAITKAIGAPELVVQPKYPDILSYRDDTGTLQFCRTALTPLDFAGLTGARLESEQAYSRRYPERVRAGFETLFAVVPAPARWGRPYNFQFHWMPEKEVTAGPGARSGCDMEAESNDPEVCQAYWVWSRLNQEVGENARFGWKIVDAHVAETAEHGWCVDGRKGSLALPVPGPGGWNPTHPADYDPYDPELGRWFRTANDSARGQFRTTEKGTNRFMQGTVHPSFRAHLAIAEAVLDQAILPTLGASTEGGNSW